MAGATVTQLAENSPHATVSAFQTPGFTTSIVFTLFFGAKKSQLPGCFGSLKKGSQSRHGTKAFQNTCTGREETQVKRHKQMQRITSAFLPFLQKHLCLKYSRMRSLFSKFLAFFFFFWSLTILEHFVDATSLPVHMTHLHI